jgi:hypothetical protein
MVIGWGISERIRVVDSVETGYTATQIQTDTIVCGGGAGDARTVVRTDGQELY